MIKSQLPPLRQHKEDLYPLMQHFFDRYASKHWKPVRGIEPEAVNALIAYDWPDNVRELKNYIERAVILSKKAKLGADDLPAICVENPRQPDVRDQCQPILSLPQKGITLQEVEKELINATLKQCNGNKSHAALRLDISRKALYEKMARHGIR